MTFSQDPWRPGAGVRPTAVEPVRKDPPKPEPEPQPAETPPRPAETAPAVETPPASDQAVQDELEKALAQMRGDA